MRWFVIGVALGFLVGCASVAPVERSANSLDGYDADTTPGCSGEGWR